MENDLKALLPLLDLLLEPIKSQLGQMNHKIDQVIHLGEKVAIAEAADIRHDTRLGDLETIQANHATELAEVRGGNRVIVWVLGLIGAPIVATLCVAGITSRFHIKIGG